MNRPTPPPPSTGRHLATRVLGLAALIAVFVVYGLVAAPREQVEPGGYPETWLGVALWAFMVLLVWVMLMGSEAALLHYSGDIGRRNANLVAAGVSVLALLVLVAPLML